MSHRKRQAPERNNRAKLELFVRLVRSFNLSEETQRGLDVNLGYSWSQETQQLVATLTQPPETDLKAMLIDLRKFVMKDSDVYVQRIHGIVYKAVARDGKGVTVEQMRIDLRESNRLWRREYESGFMKLLVNGKEYSPEIAMTLWLNGRYFHDDPDYTAFLDALDESDPMAAKLIRWQFLNAITATARYITWLAQNVDYFLSNDLLDNDVVATIMTIRERPGVTD